MTKNSWMDCFVYSNLMVNGRGEKRAQHKDSWSWSRKIEKMNERELTQDYIKNPARNPYSRNRGLYFIQMHLI